MLFARPGHRLAASLLLASLLYAGVAAAAEPPFDSAESLRAASEAWLQRQIESSERIDSLELSGEVAVDEEPEGWSVAIPPSEARLSDRGGTLQLGAGALMLSPLADGLLGLSWILPPVIELLHEGAADEEAAVLTIGRQHGRGTYATPYAGFLSLDAELGDLVAALPDGTRLTLDELGMRGESLPREEGAREEEERDTTAEADALFPRFDSSGSGRLRGLRLEGGASRLELEELRLDATLEGLELDRYAAAVAGLAGGDPAAPRLLSFADSLFHAGAAVAELSGLNFESEARAMSLGAGRLALAVDGLESTHSALVLQLALDGLRAAPLPPLTAGLLPRDAQLELELLAVPNQEMDSLLRQFSAVAATAGTRYAAGLALPDLWRLLQRAGSQVQLTRLNWDAELLRVQGSAMLNPSTEARLGLHGQLRFEIEGLPLLIEQLRGTPEAQRLIQMLTLIQGLGHPLDPAQPGGARRYEVLVAADGRLEVNGTDIMPLLPGTAR